MSHFLYSLITFCIAIFFILLGFIGIILPWSAGMQQIVISFITNNSVLIFLFGFSVLIIGALTATNVLFNMRRQYYHFRVSGQTVSVDSSLIESYVHKYLKELFPEKESPFQMQIKKNHVYLTIDLPSVPEEQQSALLEQMRGELKDLLHSVVNYRSPFHLSVSFQPTPKA